MWRQTQVWEVLDKKQVIVSIGTFGTFTVYTDVAT